MSGHVSATQTSTTAHAFERDRATHAFRLATDAILVENRRGASSCPASLARGETPVHRRFEAAAHRRRGRYRGHRARVSPLRKKRPRKIPPPSPSPPTASSPYPTARKPTHPIACASYPNSSFPTTRSCGPAMTPMQAASFRPRVPRPSRRRASSTLTAEASRRCSTGPSPRKTATTSTTCAAAPEASSGPRQTPSPENGASTTQPIRANPSAIRCLPTTARPTTRSPRSPSPRRARSGRCCRRPARKASNRCSSHRRTARRGPISPTGRTGAWPRPRIPATRAW